MADISSTMSLSGMKTGTSSPPRTPNFLRKRLTKENKKSSNFLGVKIKRFSELENYSGCSRGTLGGFLPLSDMASTDTDSFGIEKEKSVEKACVLTHLTKKIGLGIYTRGHNTVAEQGVTKEYVDLEGDERETWYMFYPPPPSPSLALEPGDWDLVSSPEAGSNSSSPSIPNVVSESEFEPKDQPRLSTFTQGSQYASSIPNSPTSDPNQDKENQNQNVDIDALILSTETLAEQYRDLLPSPDQTPRIAHFGGHQTYPENTISPFPFPPQRPSPLIFQIPVRIPTPTPKTLRKIKRQHSLRKLLDDDQPPLPFSATPTITTIPPMTTLTLTTMPAPLTQPTSPLSTQSPPTLSPPFLSTTLFPAPLHPTRLSNAAHPARSPTLNQRSGSNGKSKAKKKNPRNNLFQQPPEPPPRGSSRGRGRAAKESRKAQNDGEGTGAGIYGTGRREDEKDRGGDRETRRYGVVDMANDGGVENIGGGGWV